MVEVYVDRMEDKNGETVLSRAPRRSMDGSGAKLLKTERVNGVIFGRVKAGSPVDLGGAVLLAGSQVDIRPVRDVGLLMGSPQPFQILKMDRGRGISWFHVGRFWKKPAPSSGRNWSLV